MLIALVLDLNNSDSNPAAKAHDKTFLDHMKAIKRWEDAAKALVVAHQVIINEAAGFAKEFASSSMQNILDLPNNKDEFSK